jgi:branched-chain amino acid transport system ATP-binding protein
MIGPAYGSVYAQVLPPHIRTQGFQVTGLAVLPGLALFGPVARTIFADYGYASTFAFAIPLIIIGGLVTVSAGSFFDLDARAAFASAVARQEWRRAKASGKGKLLVCRDVDVSYSGVQVLFGVDFDVEEGQIIALLGTNGAGKSTLLRAISGTQAASGGAIVFDGRDITHMPPHEVTGRGVIHMPGGRGVFPDLTVRENLLMANWLTDDAEEIKSRLAEAFEIFPVLRERSGVKASLLSGGEQQQLSLAQAFITKPRLLMIDELSLGLSPAVVAQLLDIVREIHRRGVTIIVVEQSVNVALAIAEKAIFMEKGEVRFYGDTADLLARPDILRAVYVKGTGALTTAPVSPRRQAELADAPPVLQVRDLVKRFGGVTAVDDVSFDLRDGEVLGLIGPNGAGKTTIFELVSGFQTPDSGRIGYQGLDITDLGPEERARRGLIRRFQDARLFPSLTLFETLLVALEQQQEVRSTLLHAVAMPQARRSERRLRVRAERLVELLELGAYRDKFIKELSTGLRRITDLACVLATEPKVLLLDEPSSGIAQAEAEALAPLLGRVRHETGCSILIIEHDMPLISSVADELIALDQGGIVLRGTPDEVLNDERVIESYLGGSEEAVQRSGRL